jgi:UDPglucose 6-dehydrogenase
MGLGKLGHVLAMVLDNTGGHVVHGYDPSERPAKILAGEIQVPGEAGFEALVDCTEMKIVGSPSELVSVSETVFVVVPTPHPQEYSGEIPVPFEPRDFEYGYLVQAVRDLCTAADDQSRQITIVIVSTVLPGTVGRLVRPLLNDMTKLVYSPSLIALGTVEEDLLNPELVIIGADSTDDAFDVSRIYSTLHSRPVQVMSIESAELTKVAYNTFTSMKIVFANTMLEIAEKTGADCDAVTGALSLATDRLLSPKYLTGGVGGGGYCHPRDVIAMSWLAGRLNLSTDLFDYLAQAREDQSRWLAEKVMEWSTLLPDHAIVILGKAYKPHHDLTGGSAALLLAHQLTVRGADPLYAVDPYVDEDPSTTREIVQKGPSIFVMATDHTEFRELPFKSGSVVIDPFGHIPSRPGVTLVRLGRKH